MNCIYVLIACIRKWIFFPPFHGRFDTRGFRQCLVVQKTNEDWKELFSLHFLVSQSRVHKESSRNFSFIHYLNVIISFVPAQLKYVHYWFPDKLTSDGWSSKVFDNVSQNKAVHMERVEKRETRRMNEFLKYLFVFVVHTLCTFLYMYDASFICYSILNVITACLEFLCKWCWKSI